ncbi:MAG TPA: Arm DNA-binding domain-containing protein, partial [Flavisolibacter sp.]
MESRVSILFIGKKTKNESDKLLSIYLRVTVNGKRFEVSTQRYIEPSKWSQVAGKAKGSSEEARSINSYLDLLKNKVYDYQREILQADEPFTKETLRNKWQGVSDRSHTLVEV